MASISSNHRPSLGHLPTKLASEAFRHLGHDDFLSLTKTSKRTRAVVTPFLYQNVYFDEKRLSKVSLFLRTLTQKKDYRQYVRVLRIIVKQSKDTDTFSSLTCSEVLEIYFTLQHELANEDLDYELYRPVFEALE